MTYRVLVSAPYFQPVVDRFEQRFRQHDIEAVVPEVRERLSEAELLDLIGDIDGAICGDDAFTARVLAQAPRLRVISKWGTGIDSIDREACAERKVVVCNTPDAFSQPVADTTMGYMLFFVRRLHRLSDDMRAGRWQKQAAPSLGECVVGLIGVGNVGRAVARRLMMFGPRVLACDPIAPPPAFLEECPVEMVDKQTLLAQSDVVSLHCDLNPTSFHAINAEALGGMKKDAYVINTARGRLIDEPALVGALEAGRIAGAAMDVFEDEPLPADSPLRSMSNVFLAPHNANSSPRAWERIHHSTVDNLVRHLREQGG